MSSSDSQDEATLVWPLGDDAPSDTAPPEATSGQVYAAQSSEYTVPHTYASAGYVEAQDGAHGNAAPLEAPSDYAHPQYDEVLNHDAPAQLAAEAGLVPPPGTAPPPVSDAYPGATELQTSEPTASVAPTYFPDPAPQHDYAEPQATSLPPAESLAPQPTYPPNHHRAAAALGTHQPQPDPAVLTPRPEDLLAPDRPEITDDPAAWGWRGYINRLSGGVMKAKAKPAELDHRQAILDIQHSFTRPVTVVVIQPKGGAGKTPTTIGLAAALGVHRGGYVVGWDNNETRGTLAVRTVNRDSQRTTVWELLGALPSFERHDARVGDLGYYLRAQDEAHFDALVSDDHPGNMAQIGEVEFHRIHAVLQRFYRVIVIDTGNNVRSPNWQAALNAADVVVIPSTYQRDVGYSGSWVLDHLIQTGREELARHAVTVLTAADPTTDRKVRSQLLRHFGMRTQDIVEIPFDKHIATGGPIHWAKLNESTRRTFTQAGALVVGALTRRDPTPPGYGP